MVRNNGVIEQEIINRQLDIKLTEYKHAIVLGVGGIGSWVALNLALSGKVIKLHLIDPDIVESTNLNRTPFRLCDIGLSKVESLKYIILERRPIDVQTYQQKSSEHLRNQLKQELGVDSFNTINGDIARLNTSILIVDCRDDVFEDFYDINCKYYKVGYDGLDVTLDGNPRNTAVWGRANTYRFTPSFICPAQLAANLVVSDALTKSLDSSNMTNKEKETLPNYDTITNTNSFDLNGRLNKSLTFNSRDMIKNLFQMSLEEGK